MKKQLSAITLRIYTIFSISIFTLASVNAQNDLCNGESMSIEYNYDDTYCYWIDGYYTGDVLEPDKLDIVLSENRKRIDITNNGTRGTLKIQVEYRCNPVEWWYVEIDLYEEDENLIVALPTDYVEGEELVYAGGEKITFQVSPENDQEMFFEYDGGYLGSYTKGCGYFPPKGCSYQDQDYNVEITMLGFTDYDNHVNLKFSPPNIPCQDPLVIPIYTLKHPKQPTGPSNVNAETQQYTYYISNFDLKATDYLWEIEPSDAGTIVTEDDDWVKIIWHASYKRTAYLKVAPISETGRGTFSEKKEVNITGQPGTVTIYGPTEVCYSENTNQIEYSTDWTGNNIVWSVEGSGATISENPNYEHKATVTISSSTSYFTVKAQPFYETNPGPITEYDVTVNESGVDIDFANANTCNGQGTIPVTGIMPEGGNAWIQNYRREISGIPTKFYLITDDNTASTAFYDDQNKIGRYDNTTWDAYVKIDLSSYPTGAPVRNAYLSITMSGTTPYNGENIKFGIMGNTINLGPCASEWVDGKSGTKYNVADYNESTDPNVIKLNITHLISELKANSTSGIYLSYREETRKSFYIYNVFAYQDHQLPSFEIEYYTNGNKINTNYSIGTPYSVLYEIDGGGCSASETQTILIKQTPVSNFIAPSFCLEELPAELTGGSANMPGSGTYVGDNVLDNNIFHSNNPGNYEIMYEFTANNGCKSQSIENVNVFSPPSFAINSADEICGGNQITASVPAPSNYTSIKWTLDGQNLTGSSINFTPDKSFSGYKHLEVDVVDINGCSNTIEKDIEIFETPLLTLNDRSACQNTSFEYYPDIVGISDGSNLSYQWSTGEATDHINVFVQSTQQIGLTVTSQNNCSASDNMTIIMLSSHNVSVNDDEVCFGQQATLTASPFIPSWSYQWSNGRRGNEITVIPNSTGNNEYTVWATDDNGCMNSANSIVHVNELPSFTLPDQDACYGVQTTISAPPGFRNYAWSTGVSSSSVISITPSTSQLISCEVEDYNGCTNSSSMTLNVHTPMPLLLQNINACKDDQVTLEGPLGFDYYRWSNGVEFRTTEVIADQNRNYTLQVVDVHGCDNEATMTLFANPYPILNMADQGINEGESATIYAPSGYSQYLWSTGHIDDFITVSPEEDTEYWVKITTDVSCASSDTFLVIIYDIPEIVIDDINMCEGETIEIEAPEGFVTYKWTTAEQTYEGRVISVSPETNTVFNLEVTTPTGGVGGTSFIVYVYALPAIDAEDDLICYGDEKTITTLDGFYSYLWSTGSTTNTITVSPTETTTYGLTVTNGYGCKNEADIKITVDNPSTDFTASMEKIRPGDPVQFVVNSINETSEYKWTFGDNNGGLGPDIIHYYYEEGLFNVSLDVLSVNQCAAITTKIDFINVNENNSGVSVKENNLDILGIKLYPVPVRSVLQIDASSYNKTSEMEFSIYSSSGKLMSSFMINPKDIYELSMSDYPNGQYIVMLRVNGIISSQKIVKID